MTNTISAADVDLRAGARKRLEKRAAAWRFLLLWAVLTVLFVAIWALTSPAAYFWPVWPTIGVGIGVVFSFLDAYTGLGTVSEQRVDEELLRMRA